MTCLVHLSQHFWGYGRDVLGFSVGLAGIYRSGILFVAAVGALLAQSGPTLPKGGNFVAGVGTIGAASGGSLGITQSSARGVIDWSSFSIGAGGRVLINNGSGATLNRVIGSDLSRIDGLLKASGSIYLINQNGVVVGPKSCVLTDGSFVASSRNIGNSVFMAGGALTASGTSAGNVVNQGSILARQGDVVLIGRSVENSGSIRAPKGTATLATGDNVLLTTVGGPSGVYVSPGMSGSGTLTQSGRIEAAAAALKAGGGDIYTLAGNRTGLISATGTKTINGEVWLSAPSGQVVAGGDISARNADGSGGRVVANGAQISVASGARISAEGSAGGTVLVGVSTPGGTDLANTTKIGDGASIWAGGPAGGGLVETSGHNVSIGKATIGAGQSGVWRVDPTDLTIDSTAAFTITSSLNSGTNVTEQTTAGGGGTDPGNINVNSTITWTGTGALTLSAYHDLNLNAAISGAGGFTGQAGGGVNVNANVAASNVLMTAGGNLTLGSGVTVAGGNGVTLQTTGNFINNAGAGALSGGTGRWLVYSSDPSADTTGGLASDFLQYAATGGTAPLAAGNGLLYSVTPALSVALSGTVDKTYEGTTSATFTNSNAAVSGLINSDAATVTGSYASKNAGSGIAVTASNIAITHSGVPVYGYVGTTPSVSANIGQIDPATVSASIVGTPTKTYNGTTTASLSSANYQLSGFASGEGATVNQPSSVAYDSANAGDRMISATFSPTNFGPNSGTSLSNYVLPTSATGAGHINQAPLLISGVLGTDKVYDRTTNDPLSTGAAALYGVINSDDVSLVGSGATGTFSTANVGSSLPVTASGFTLSGTKAPNYALTQPSGLTASINPASLTVGGVNAMGKVYDATNTAPLNTSSATLNGAIPGDTLTLGTSGASGTFASSDVGTAIGVTASGFTFSGTGAQNYRISQPSGLSADITAKPLSVAIVSTPSKTYNGDAGAVVDSSSFNLTGFVGGQSATVGQTSHVAYATPNAGTQTVTATLAVSDYSAGSGTKLSNYVLPTSATGTGVINPAPITMSIVDDPTKVYDGNASTSLNSSNYSLSGFLAGQSATVNQSAGSYDSANAGVRQVTATLGAENFTPGSGTLLSNYSFPTTVIGSGTILPQPLEGGISASITGNPTKFYDGTTVATLTPSDFTLSGFTSGQGATVTQTVGQYWSKNVGVQAVTANLAQSDFTPNSGTDLSNYTLPPIAYGSGAINPAVLTASVIGNPTKVYNGTTRAALAGGNFSISGLASGEGVNLSDAIQAAYDAKQAGSRTVTANIAVTDITPQSGTLLSNYVLPTSATGAGQITQAPLSILDVSALNKTYDTTTAAPLSTGGAHLFGVVGSDNVTLSTSGATGVFAAPNAGSGIAVTASGFSVSGADKDNYQLFQPTGLSATIYRAPLSLTGVSAVDKFYNNTNAATLNSGSAGLSGVLSPDVGQVGFDASGATASFASVNVGNNLAVTAGGFALNGAQSANYALIQPTGLKANINPQPLTANIIGNPTKVYDGSNSTTLTAANYQLVGFVAGQGASLPQSATAQYLVPDAGLQGIHSTLVSSDFVANSGTNLSNYVLPTAGNGTGTITQAPLTAAITGNPTKTYDATTTATLTSGNYALSGFVPGQSATVTQTAGLYGTADAGVRSVTATLASGDFTAGGATNLNNYSLPTSATGTGTINKAPLQVVNVAGTNRAYNGGFGDPLNVSSAGVSGLFGSDGVTLNSGSATGTFASKDVGTGIGVTAAGFTISAGQSANYTLAQPTGLSADITQASLNLTKVTRQYDSTTGLPTASGAYTLAGVFGSDAVTVDTSGIGGSYADKNVGTGKNVSLTGVALGGAQAADYTIAPSFTNATIGEITTAPLTVAGVIANNKVYNATTDATLDNSSAALSGLFNGDAVMLDTTGATAAFSDKNVGNGKTVTASGYTASGVDYGNYSFTQPTGLSANITPYGGISLASVTKTYDGGTSLPTASSAYVLSGFLGSDSVQVLTSGLSGGYASANVGSSLPVSLSGLALTGTDAANYSIGSTLSNANIGFINQKALSAAIIGTPTKTYDTTTAATLGTGNYQLNGFVTGEGATVTKTSGTYAGANAGSPNVSTSLVSGDFNPNGGTLLTNYLLPTSASGAGKINKAPLTITGVAATNKTYNGNTTDALNNGSAALSGVFSADLGSVTLNSASATGTFASKNVGTGIGVTAGGFSIGGGQATNYALAQPTGLSADITQATVNLASVNKVYDATTSAVGAGVSYTLSGVVGGDAVSVNTSGLAGSYDAKNVGTGLGVSLTGLTLAGAQAANYSIGSSVTEALIGNISKAQLYITGASAVGKVYEGTTAATLDNSGAQLSGRLGVDDVALTSPTSGTFASANAGTWGVTPGSYTISGTDYGNYNLNQPTGLSASIAQAPLSISIANNPTKTYNGTTAATLTSSNYSLTGFIGSQGTTVGQTTGTYDVADAGSRTVTAALAAGNYTPTGGANLSNYILPTTASGTGTINQKNLTATISGNPTKTYDGGTGATLGSSDYTLNGFVSGQGATVGQMVGTYASADAGSRGVTATLSAGNFTATGGANFANYILPTTASGTGTINQKGLTAVISGAPTKTYDGGTVATLASSDYALSGFIGGQGAMVGQTVGTYASANAGSRGVTAALSAGNFTATGGANLSNYILPTTASGTGSINQKGLTAVISGAPTKTYDGGTGATLGSSDYMLSGFVGSQGATVGQTAGTYASADAGSRGVTTTLSAGNFTATGGANLANYILPTSASGTGTINQEGLTATISGDPTKTYDGGTVATLASSDYTLSGFIGGQGATVGQTVGTYASADAGSRGVTATLSAGDFTATGGANLANYILPTTASGTGMINQKGLTAVISGDPTKIYDGGTGATLASSDYTLNGFIGSEGATVGQTVGTYALADAGSRGVTTTLSAGNFTATGGANLSNYILPTTASGAGTINQKGLTAVISGDPTKTYDGGTGATLGSSDYTLNGFVSGQGAMIGQTVGTYASADAGSRGVMTTLSAGNFTATGGASLSNYILPTTASGTGTINQKGLTAVISGDPTKTYDGGTVATLASTDYTLSGFIGSEGATVGQTAGTYASADAGSRGVMATLSAGNFAATGGANLSNYILPMTASGTGSINQKGLTAVISGDPTKTYDGGTVATLASSDYTMGGFVGSEGATVGQTVGRYASADAGSQGVTTTLSAGNFTATGGANLANYILPATASGTGAINHKGLTAVVGGNPTKTYDGGTGATLAPSDYTLNGFVSGQGATVTKTSGAYDLADAGSRTVAATLGSGDFTQNSGTNLANYLLPTTASGAGAINQKTLTAAITGDPTKTYDGSTTATLASSDYTLSGFVTGQGATLSPGTGTYDAADAGSRTVTAALGSGDFTQGSGTNLSNYILPTTASGTGTINQKALSAAISGTPTKTYDGTTAAALAASDYTLSGFVSGQGATVTEAAGTYDTADAGSHNVIAALSSSDFTANGGTNLANYMLPTTASGVGAINQRTLTAAITGNPSKTYDGANGATINAGDYTLSGFVNGQGASVSQGVGTYDAADAGSRTVTTNLNSGDFAQNGGTNLSNYVLPTTASGAGTINAKSLAAAIIGNPSKTYDGGAAATLASSDYTLSGFVSGQGATVNAPAGTYDAADAGSRTVTATLGASDFTGSGGTNLANYTLPTAASGAGTIEQKTLTAAITGNPTRNYDGTAIVTLGTGDFSLSGFVSGQGAAVTQTAGTYDGPDAGSHTVETALSAGNFTASGGTNLVNYVLPTAATGAGTINPQALTATIVNASKTYDGSTSAVLGANNYVLTGFASGQGATVTQTAGTYAFAEAGPRSVMAALSAGDLILTGGTNPANYILPTSASGTGLISPQALTAAITGKPSKIYDGLTAASLGSGDYTLTGFVAGQGAIVTQTEGTYDLADAGQRSVNATLRVGNFTAVVGTNLANYILPVSAAGVGSIDLRPLSAAIVGVPTKMKDGTTVATLSAANFTLSGFVGGQGASVAQRIGSFDSVESGSRIVTALLAARNFAPNAGTLLSNYLLPNSATGSGLITPAILTNAPTLADAISVNMTIRNLASAAQIATMTAQAVFGVAVPRAYIPYPAPSTLSTWQNNGFGLLPTIVVLNSANSAGPTSGAWVISGGSPLINSTEQILLQGGKNKSWQLLLPPVTSATGSAR